MNILVCIKQVPDVEKVKFCPETRTLLREGVENIMNPFDRHALEVALMMKDKVGAKVTCLSMGLPMATDVLKEAEKIKDTILRQSEFLDSNPEVGFEVFKTKK